MKRTPEEQAAYRKQYNKEHSLKYRAEHPEKYAGYSQKYRAEHPERYARYMIKTSVRKLKSLGIDARATVEEILKEVERGE